MQEGSSHDFPDGEIFFIELLLFFANLSISGNSSMAAVIDEKIVRGHTLIILSPCHQGNHYILTPRKYYLQYKQKYDRLNRFGRLFVMAGSLPCIFW